MAPVVTATSIILSSNKAGKPRFTWKMAVAVDREDVTGCKKTNIALYNSNILAVTSRRDKIPNRPSSGP